MWDPIWDRKTFSDDYYNNNQRVANGWESQVVLSNGNFNMNYVVGVL